MSLQSSYQFEEPLDLSKSAMNYPKSLPSSFSDSSFSDTISIPDFSTESFDSNSQSSGLSSSSPQIVPFKNLSVSPLQIKYQPKNVPPHSSTARPDSIRAEEDRNYFADRANLLKDHRAQNAELILTSMTRKYRSLRQPEESDSRYFQLRQRNNAAVKKSRELRRQRQEELTNRASYLEQANADLRARILALSKCYFCRQPC